MNKFNQFYSKRFFMILFLICLFFFVVIIKAFEIMMNSENLRNVNTVQIIKTTEKQNNGQKIDSDKNINSNDIENDDENDDENDEDTVDVKIQKKIQNKKMKKYRDFEEMDEIGDVDESISEEKSEVKVVNAEEIYKIFLQAREYKLNNKLTEAIEELEKVENLTKDNEMIAKSYEEISNLYAIQKRYGSAMTFAQKAYGIKPTSSREFLIARLCYKTGNIDRAKSKIESILKKDFVID